MYDVAKQYNSTIVGNNYNPNVSSDQNHNTGVCFNPYLLSYTVFDLWLCIKMYHLGIPTVKPNYFFP